MNRHKIILLLINIVGGILVIGSYIYGLNAQSAGAAVLWGGVPLNIQTIYAVSMIISAIGYFAFIYYLLDPYKGGAFYCRIRFTGFGMGVD